MCTGLLLPGCGGDGRPEATSGLTFSPPTTNGDTGDGTTDAAAEDSTSDDPSAESTTPPPDDSTGPMSECGNGVVEGEEVCDGEDLAGEDCISQGFDEGTVVCDDDCLGIDIADCVFVECGDGVLNGGELCDGADVGDATCEDEGFDSGQLTCNPGCQSYNTGTCGTCGNMVIDGDEVCDTDEVDGQECTDEGFDSGTLACGNDCMTYETSGCGTCGNGVRDGDEVCDSDDIGTATCAGLGFGGGTLGCNGSCNFDLSSCDISGVEFDSDAGYTGYEITPAITTCDEISGTGTATGLSDDDNSVVNMGFTFTFYGTDYTSVNIQSNGALVFGSNLSLTFGNGCLPTATNPSDDVIYVFWDDLNPGAAGDVYYETLGAAGDQRFVVQWDVPHYGGNTMDLLRFQAVMHEATGQIDVCYVDTQSAGNADDNGAGATAGMQHDSANGLEYSCDSAVLVDGLQLLYIPN